MDRQDILEHLKRTEADVKARVEAAEKKAAEIKDHAGKQAKAILHEGEQQAAKDAQRLLSEANAVFNTERQRVLAAATAEAAGLKQKAQVTKAQEYFLSKFHEYLHV